MREQINGSLEVATNLSEVEHRLLDTIHQVKSEIERDRIGYVAGVISSDGEEHIPSNIRRLSEHTNFLEQQYDFPVFCAADVFSRELFEQLEEMAFDTKTREQHFLLFWRNILTSGHITDVFMTPGWDRSRGATDEYECAKSHNLRVHCV